MRVDGTGDRRVAIVEGVAYPALVVGTDGTIAPEDVSRIDTYRTWMAPETLRRFAHFMLERGSGGIDSAHDHGNVGCIVESHYRREAADGYPANVWVVAAKVLRADAVGAIERGELTGFSIEFTGTYAERTLLAGKTKLRTAEIVDPYPLTLSVVDKPATRMAFTGVDVRSAQKEPDAGITDDAAPVALVTPPDTHARVAHQRADVLVRFTQETPMTVAATPTTGTTGTTPTDQPPVVSTTGTTTAATEQPAAPAVPATRAAESTTPTTPTTAVPVAVTPEFVEALAAQLRGALRAEPRSTANAASVLGEEKASSLRRAYEAIVAEARTATATGKRASVDYTDLASIVDTFGDVWAFNDAVSRVVYMAEMVWYEIQYLTEGQEKVDKVRKFGADFTAAINAVCDDAGPGLTGARSEGGTATTAVTTAPAVTSARAGKKYSKATMARMQKAHDGASACAAELRGMLDEGEEKDDDSEAPGLDAAEETAERADLATRAARAAEEDAARVKAAVDTAVTAAVAETRAQAETDRAALVLAHETALRAAEEKASTTAASLTTVTGERDAARDALARALKRVEQLEGARPAPRSAVEETPVPPPSANNGGGNAAEQARAENPFAGVLGLRSIAPR